MSPILQKQRQQTDLDSHLCGGPNFYAMKTKTTDEIVHHLNQEAEVKQLGNINY